VDRHKNRKSAHNFIDLTNRRFDKLLVVKDSGKRKSKRPIWVCVCDCGTVTEISAKYLLSGDTKSCGCFSKGNAYNRDAVGMITKSFWTPIEKQAKKRGIPMEIDREYAWEIFKLQDEKCALSGLKLSFVNNIRDERNTHTASLDRIDNTKGYIIGNIQWVHKRINIMRNTLSVDEFINWCNLVVKNQDKNV
jgi:hypothetical protein